MAMAKFEEIFRVPPVHRLRQTSFHSGGGGQYDKWTHEELDATGRLVARYESWAHTTYTGSPTDEGWKKFVLNGPLVAFGDDLPL